MNEQCWYADIDDTEFRCLKGKSVHWCDENCPVYKNTLSQFKGSNLPENYWNPFPMSKIPVDSTEIGHIIEIKQELNSFVEQGKNLLLQSNKCGNGKTSWGIKLLQRYIELNCNHSDLCCFFVYVPNLLLAARESINKKNSIFDTYKTGIELADLVMLDDIGCMPLKDYDLLILSSLIEERIMNKKSVIFTTNLMDESLKVNLGDRLYDRIYRLSEKITLKSDSLRGK